MGRYARFVPKNTDGVLVEVTYRTIGTRALLLPSPDPRRFNEVVVGVMGRALEVSPLELCSAVWLANHWLCAAAHNQCYVESSVMWGCRTLLNENAGIGGGMSRSLLKFGSSGPGYEFYAMASSLSSSSCL